MTRENAEKVISILGAHPQVTLVRSGDQWGVSIKDDPDHYGDPQSAVIIGMVTRDTVDTGAPYWEPPPFADHWD